VQRTVWHQIDIGANQLTDLPFKNTKLHQAQWACHGEQEINIRTTAICFSGNGPEDSQVASPNLGYHAPDLAGILT